MDGARHRLWGRVRFPDRGSLRGSHRQGHRRGLDRGDADGGLRGINDSRSEESGVPSGDRRKSAGRVNAASPTAHSQWLSWRRRPGRIVLEQHLLLIKEAFEPLGITQRQIAAEDDTVEARQHAGHPFLMLDDEAVIVSNGSHGVFSGGCWWRSITPSSLGKTPFARLFWLRRSCGRCRCRPSGPGRCPARAGRGEWIASASGRSTASGHESVVMSLALVIG